MGNIYQTCCIEEPSATQLKPKPSYSSESIQINNDLSLSRMEPESVRSNWNDFQSVRYLCRSEFGQVAIVKLKGRTQGKEYVMKIVEKAKIKQENLLQSNFLELKILKQDNPFIVKILHVSQNRTNIYIVMEFIAGRDLYYYLKEEAEAETKRYFTEQIIRQIVAQVIIGLQYLHSNGIIYRELKPENILCTEEGHVKLTDYVLSRFDKINEPTMTYLGNAEYTAPQMLGRAKGYNRSADLWSLGVLLYQLKYAITPFKGENLSDIESKIALGNISFPHSPKISDDLKDLIQRLVKVDSLQRLQLNQVKKHKFFESVNWEDVKNRKNQTGLKQIMARYNLRIRGKNDNPPPRLYMKEAPRQHLTTPFIQYTCPTQESFKVEHQ